ncbi:MAG: hypothetical protein IPG97_03090 [Microthrixaceae bacterium]|nr:hypothetical protein [Microthrixaceae bacterium]
MNSAPEPFPIGTTPAGLEVTSLMIDLDDDRALDPMTTGGKAAALARVRSAGLATLPGVVLTTVACRAYDRGVDLAALVDVDRSLTLASADGALVVRSSSVVEDGARSSWAGQFGDSSRCSRAGGIAWPRFESSWTPGIEQARLICPRRS